MSSNIIESEEYRGYTLNLHWDSDPENPRTFDGSLGTMVCSHGRYYLGDVQDYKPDFATNWRQHTLEYFADKYDTGVEKKCYYDSDEELEKFYDRVEKWVDKNVIMTSLYLYDHSGITMSTSSFSSRWDSGQVGFIYATREQIIEWFNKKRLSSKMREQAEELIENAVKVYDSYLRGDVYAVEVLNADGDSVEFYGGYYDREEAISEAKCIIDADIKHTVN